MLQQIWSSAEKDSKVQRINNCEILNVNRHQDITRTKSKQDKIYIYSNTEDNTEEQSPGYPPNL